MYQFEIQLIFYLLICCAFRVVTQNFHISFARIVPELNVVPRHSVMENSVVLPQTVYYLEIGQEGFYLERKPTTA